MSTPRTEQEQLELETASLDHAISMGEAWIRLQKDPDFIKIIMDGFCKDKVLASHSLLAVPQIVEKGHRGNIMEDLVASSNLLYFFKIIEHEYAGATAPILSDEEEDEMLAEQVAEANAQLVN